MKTLFLRIFLWFWLTVVLVGTVLVLSSPFMTRTRPHLADWERHEADRVLSDIERIADGIERKGFRAGGSSSGGPRHRGRPMGPRMIQVYDEQGEPLTAGPDDQDARALAREALAQGEAVAQRRGNRHMAARPVTDPDGRRFAVVGEIQGPPRLIDLIEPRVLIPRLVILALVAGALVWWLAQHLTAPVTVLRKTTGQLAAGDLGARVGSGVAARRDEIGGLARDFNGMADHVERLVENQRRLLGDVSHELRSPLARLGVALELARQKSPAAAQDHLDRIEREAERLDDLIARLLEFARMERGPLHREDFDLGALVEEIASDASFESGGTEVGVRVSGDGPVTVAGDRELLRSAIGNVIRNAVFFTQPETGVDVELGAADGRARIVVADRGPGVPEAELEKIFDVFYRIEDAREREHGGAGLGLAIAARAVARHGGTIVAANRDGGGLAVTMTLPLAGAV